MTHKIIHAIYLTLAVLFLVIGTIGVVLPILPTTPFIMLASFFFLKGSKRVGSWFQNTRIYRQYAKDFVETKTMTRKNKIRILVTATALILISCILVNNLHVRIFLLIIIGIHYYYLLFRIQTKSETIDDNQDIAEEKLNN